MILRTILGAIAVLLCASSSWAAGQDGRLFDHGAAMTELAEGASEATGHLLPIRGQWDVRFTLYGEGGEVQTTDARASTTLMNRGHGYLERYACDDFDGQGNERHSVSFLTHTPSTGVWNLGIADSWSESVTLYSGDFEGDELIVDVIDRRGGSGVLIHRRITLSLSGDDAYTLRAEQGNYAEDLATVWSRSYTRRVEDPEFMVGEGYGEAASGLPEEAHQFDFLLGEWEMQNEMTFPNGQVAKWPANGTAVRILGGHAIMEHGWFDLDPNVPDAATTIVRIYNRAMRRWESMYSTNRFNSILFFGGVLEGNRIVLHSFASDTASGTFSYWTFHDMQADSYGWFANTSTDRGESFKKTWIISGTRRGSSR